MKSRVHEVFAQHDTIIEMNNKKLGITKIALRLKVDKKVIRKYCLSNGIELHRRTYYNQCKECNETFESIRYNNKFCSTRCKAKWNTRYYKENDISNTCECKQCNKVFEVPKKKGYKAICKECTYNNKTKHLVGMSCSLIGQHSSVFIKRCNQCNIYFTSNIRKQFCSEKCRKKSAVRIVYSKKCKECGKHYSHSYQASRYCSVQCSKRYQNRQKEIKRRKRIMLNGSYDTSISIERLIKRDGCKCYICGNDTDKTLHYNEDKYPTIEHVIPIAKGGIHAWENVKLACRSCNNEKGIKALGEIM
ncbi:hypothetical protein BHU61_06705 [Macrococcus epidermidis]|uniref:HNH nuclease domain-containing protein n=1 Tax=Macrococcus epidermidis TaxID=1902580 RepID=A0A327ZVF6_9STAP|nr:HNH endonuclease [Macrococcus epidermidis]RAK44998.1 hypothetical protein BHU61_06705 [Macrococcus epidermidis]